MTRRELAESNFVAGYSCAQAVVKAFADVTGFDGEAAMRLCSSFGGGMGRLREVCGAVSGMFIVEGLLEGYFDPTEQDAQAQKQRIMRVFKNLQDVLKNATRQSYVVRFLAQEQAPIPLPKRELPNITKRVRAQKCAVTRRKSLKTS